MSFACGIVGLPNVGKSTLFNALSSAKAEAQNYPFCTIEPNVGVVTVPDSRLDALVKLFNPPKIVPAAIRFVDIAGLVRGASKGEGLGNQFLSHIREVDAILHVVRCFEDPNVIHVENRINPVADVETITAELCLKDLDTVDKRRERSKKMIKANKPEDRLAIEICDLLTAQLDQMKPVRALLASALAEGAKPSALSSVDARIIVRDMQLLTVQAQPLRRQCRRRVSRRCLEEPALRCSRGARPERAGPESSPSRPRSRRRSPSSNLPIGPSFSPAQG